MLREQTFDRGVVKINYAEGPPSGLPLVLLHGGGDRWQAFLSIIPSLAARWHIYALDLRGHGKSGYVLGQYRPEHYAADVIAFLEYRQTEPVILFGHSLGGWIALMCAAQCADKVRALILADPPIDIERYVAFESSEERVSLWRALRDLAGSELSVAELASALAGLPVPVPGKDQPVRYGDMPGVDEAQLRCWAKTLRQVDPDAARYHAEGRMREYVEHVDMNTLLRQVSCPVLLLQGNPSRGGLVSDADVQHALSLLADGQHVRLENAGHDLGLSAWEVGPLLRAVTNFLESL